MIFEPRIETMMAVAEAGSLSRAAKRLSLTQPSLSVQISKLESELGFAIFERSPQGVTLTKPGESLYRDMLRLRRLADAAVGRAGLLSCDKGSLTVGLVSSRETPLYERALDALHRDHPEVEIALRIVPRPLGQRAMAVRDG
ncbi:MAG: LysR family transcriptional regulator, partial [Eggerthellales bacterium]|nr:LysR family transcriptional regulator [Eggerthellales bacterium]